MTEFRPQFPKNLSKPPFPVMLLGEAPGKEEEISGQPFVGRSGQLLRKTLSEIDINPDNLMITNVFWERPTDNDISLFFGHKATSKVCDDFTSIGNQFLLEKHRHHLERLQNELDVVQPKLVVALGRIPLWALTGKEGITKFAGQKLPVDGVVKHPNGCLVVNHPAYILRNRSMIPTWQKQLAVIKEFM